MQKKRVLTGITTTGTPHLGNYVGAIRPAIGASHADEVESFYFLADYHSLIKCDDPAQVRQSSKEIAATWLALGLDTEKSVFYRQSDIPEILELTWVLTCNAAKGLMRALQYGINRYPAIVFDGQAVVYGVTDIETAARLYDHWMEQNR